MLPCLNHTHEEEKIAGVKHEEHQPSGDLHACVQEKTNLLLQCCTSHCFMCKPSLLQPRHAGTPTQSTCITRQCNQAKGPRPCVAHICLRHGLPGNQCTNHTLLCLSRRVEVSRRAALSLTSTPAPDIYLPTVDTADADAAPAVPTAAAGVALRGTATRSSCSACGAACVSRLHVQ